MACKVKRKRWNYKQIYERVIEKWQQKEMKAANCWISCCFSTRPSQSRAPWTLFCLGSVPDSRYKEDIRCLHWASDRGLFIISPRLHRNGNANFQAQGYFTNVHACVRVYSILVALKLQINKRNLTIKNSQLHSNQRVLIWKHPGRCSHYSVIQLYLEFPLCRK